MVIYYILGLFPQKPSVILSTFTRVFPSRPEFNTNSIFHTSLFQKRVLKRKRFHSIFPRFTFTRGICLCCNSCETPCRSKTREKKNDQQVRTIGLIHHATPRRDSESTNYSPYHDRIYNISIQAFSFSLLSNLCAIETRQNADAATFRKCRKPRVKLILQRSYVHAWIVDRRNSRGKISLSGVSTNDNGVVNGSSRIIN